MQKRLKIEQEFEPPRTASEPQAAVEARALKTLEQALAIWTGRARPESLARWLERELDPDGVPRTLEVSLWREGLRRLSAACLERPDGWPDGFDARIEGWFRALLRYSRPDASAVFGLKGPSEGARALFRFWAERSSDPGLSTVLDWWFPRSSTGHHAPPPLPADARPDRPLAVLRANWARDGDLLAIDHRTAGTTTTFELLGLGRTWLGPSWRSFDIDNSARTTRARPTVWMSHSSADLVEWTYRIGKARVVRSATLLRGRRLALLGEQWDGPDDPGAFRFQLADGIEAGPVAESRGLALTSTRGRVASARVFPIGLPRSPYPTDRGSFEHADGDLILQQRAETGARRVWRPLLVSWEPARNRQTVQWRTLTVSENGRACPPGVAFAARITWGRDETLVIYRSLARPALRAFLGHQTSARFLVGLFTAEGEVKPLLKVEE